MATEHIDTTLPGKLSPEVEAAVAQTIASGTLSEYATPNSACIRRKDEDRDQPDALRPAFNRDIEKILHTNSYNRLAGKTQVFSFRSDDDITRRGLHVQLVSRVARDIGRALGLNNDLIEAIALGHDVGHTPFGHAGENFLDRIYQQRTGKRFLHNVHSVRVLDTLAGRNLSLQVLDGILAHNGECEQQRFDTSGLSSFEELDAKIAECESVGFDAASAIRPMTLEGCVVRVSDIIAYVGKDRQDAVHAGYVAEDQFEGGKGGTYNSWALQNFITDVVENSYGKDHIEMSEAAFNELKRAKAENNHIIYKNSEIQGEYSETVFEIFESVYDAILKDLASGDRDTPVFKHHIEPVTERLEYYGGTYDWDSDHDRTTADFIAAMTDDYFIAYALRIMPRLEKALAVRSYFDDLDR